MQTPLGAPATTVVPTTAAPQRRWRDRDGQHRTLSPLATPRRRVARPLTGRAWPRSQTALTASRPSQVARSRRSQTVDQRRRGCRGAAPPGLWPAPRRPPITCARTPPPAPLHPCGRCGPERKSHQRHHRRARPPKRGREVGGGGERGGGGRAAPSCRHRSPRRFYARITWSRSRARKTAGVGAAAPAPTASPLHRPLQRRRQRTQEPPPPAAVARAVPAAINAPPARRRPNAQTAAHKDRSRR